MTGWLYLLGAIVAEVIATSALKQVEGLSRPLPLVATVIGYVIAFSLMSMSLRTIPIGVAYAVWSGVGIVAISIIGLFAFGQKLDLPALLGIALIVAGVGVIQLFSKSNA
ncbi:DMT family transporter [Methyloversatilis thermotolerans]|uniref:DMT family transporter n=1 Tax=Methyloversatilis thermotolerans TaxID=1346290 RepID=UPI000375B94F|nr:multidrug efflux SMR transporter [Methyloversatilis thermotolerans]